MITQELGYVSGKLVDHYNEICGIFKKFNVTQVRIFGSVARMEDKETSDLDLLVDMPAKSTLIQLGQLQHELQQLLHIPMDVITYACLDPLVLEHFKQISIDFFEIRGQKRENAMKGAMTAQDKVRKNGKSAIWVIDRILNCCKGITQERFLTDSVIQDAVTRNVQLLGQVVSQIPDEEWIGEREYYFKIRQGCMVLRNALFMNVDLGLLWNTVTIELPQFREMLCKALASA